MRSLLPSPSPTMNVLAFGSSLLFLPISLLPNWFACDLYISLFAPLRTESSISWEAYIRVGDIMDIFLTVWEKVFGMLGAVATVKKRSLSFTKLRWILSQTLVVFQNDSSFILLAYSCICPSHLLFVPYVRTGLSRSTAPNVGLNLAGLEASSVA